MARRDFVPIIFIVAVLSLFFFSILYTKKDFTPRYNAPSRIPTKELEQVLEERPNHPHSPRNLHPEGLTLINITDFQIPINYDICNVSDLALVTIIHSAVKNKEARNVIRTTWGNPDIPGVNTRLVFLLGQTDNQKDQNELESEADQFYDIVQGGFHDSYHNLSYKNVFGKLWVSQFCENAEFVVKTDDDMFIDLFAVYAVSRQYLEHAQYGSGDFILCPVWHGMPILREPSSKWYVSYDDISQADAPGNVYPEYCTGWIYILNPKTAGRLVEIAKTTRFFWIDDAWVTGILVKALKFKHLDMMTYFTMHTEKMLVVKSSQNPEIYHKDLIAAPMSRNFEVSMTMFKHSEWCYLNKCYNNIYHQHPNLTEYDLIFDRVMSNHIPGIKPK